MKNLLIYLGILFSIMVFRSSSIAPSLIYRLLYCLALFLPLIIKGRKIYLPCLITFLTINLHSFAYGFLPYDVVVYALLSLFTILLYRPKHLNFRLGYILSFLCVFFTNVIYSGDPQNIFWCICTIWCCSCLDRNYNRENQRYYMLNAFSIISVVLALLYLLNYDSFLITYSARDNITRAGWTDPNYLSCILGMGALSSLILLLRGYSKNTYIKSFWGAVIVISIMAQSLIASRGSLLALSVSTVFLLLFLKIKIRYKFIILLSFGCFVTWLYTNSYLDLLSYRMENDSVDSGRMEIWNMKMSIFFSEGNILTWLFGVGYKNAFAMSNTSSVIGFHNDFLAILCAYGIVGLLLFIFTIFIYPLLNAPRSNLHIVATLIIYLCVVCLTLEPLSSGDITYWTFFYLIFLFASNYTAPSSYQ